MTRAVIVLLASVACAHSHAAAVAAVNPVPTVVKVPTAVNPVPTMTCPVGYRPAQKYTIQLGERVLQTACLKNGDKLIDGCYVVELNEGMFWGCDGRKMSSDYPTLDEIGICHRREIKADDPYCQNPWYEVGDYCWVPVCDCPRPPGYKPREYNPCVAKEKPRAEK